MINSWKVFLHPLPCRDSSQVQLGLAFFIPTLILDALFMVPDYSSTPEQVHGRILGRLFNAPDEDASVKLFKQYV